MLQPGFEHLKAGRFADARQVAEARLETHPDEPRALYLRGLADWNLGERAAAVAAIERAVEIGGEGLGGWLRDLCEMCRVQGRLDEALAHGLRAVALDEGDVDALYNLGIVQQDVGQIAEAIVTLRRAIALKPDHAGAHFELAEALLLDGDFKPGWEEYEWRFRMPGTPPPMPPTQAPIWEGQPMPNGRLLLVGDQGFGDVLQFMRYIPHAAARCGELVIACSEEMDPFVAQLSGAARRFRLWREAPAFDAYTTLSGLPRLFGANLKTIPAQVPYLRAEPARLAHWRARLQAMTPLGHRRIGVVWAGRPTHGNDRNRSITLRQLAPLANLKQTVLVSMQKGEAAGQIGSYYGGAPLLNLGPEIKDFADTAAIIQNLDLVVTVDTSVAHLSGALGQRTLVLLPFTPDWRWLRERTDSPWYPTLKLYRQSRPGAWDEPIARLAADLGRR
jgi:tetratricopeptide (TPR) repeat protein